MGKEQSNLDFEKSEKIRLLIAIKKAMYLLQENYVVEALTVLEDAYYRIND